MAIVAILTRLLPVFGVITALAGSIAYTMGKARGIQLDAHRAGYSEAVLDQSQEIEKLRAENVALIAAADARVDDVRRQNEADRAEERATFARQLRNARNENETLNVCLGLPPLLPDGLRRETAAADPGAGGDEG